MRAPQGPILQPAAAVDAEVLLRLSELDAAFLAAVLAAITIPLRPDPWGAYVALDGDGAAVGACCFKAAPNARRVEIAYGTAPSREGKGWATGMARALIEIAAASGAVDGVLAHTLREDSASTAILRRCGFALDGDAIDPEDGPVWRWSLRLRA